MPINTQDLMDGISVLADQQNMRVTVKQSCKGAMICAATCFVGGMILGPVGLAIGGTAGGISAAMMSKGSFKPVSEIIRNDLTVQEREMLTEKIIGAVREFEPTDLALLLPLIMGNPSIQQSVLRTVTSFISELSLFFELLSE